MKLTSNALGLVAVAATTALASAQVTVISTEQFDYQVPSLLLNAAGGTGWLAPWDIPAGMGNEVVMFDQTINPPMTCPDAVGGYAGQASEFFAAVRQPNLVAHADILDGSFVGADGSTVWISFRTQQYQVFGDSFGALQLFQSTDSSNEQLLLGSPWATNAWGLDDEGGVGLPPEVVTGSAAAVCAKLVYRIDHQPGDERIRMWIDPVDDYPLTPADLDTLISDLRWDEVRLNSGGSGTHFFWDDITIAKGIPSDNIATNYCGPAVTNSTGLPGELSVRGSDVAADNDVELVAINIPTNAFGFSVVSTAQAFVMNPGGSQGNLCLGGAIGRYVGPGQITNAGQAGILRLTLDLTQTPQPQGFVSIGAGQTWNFQTWYRDSVGGMATSNFTDGASVMFL